MSFPFSSMISSIYKPPVFEKGFFHHMILPYKQCIQGIYDNVYIIGDNVINNIITMISPIVYRGFCSHV